MSWVVNLFTPGHSSHFASPDDRRGRVYANPKQNGSEHVAVIRGGRREEYTEPMDEEEEAARAPYWHVSFTGTT